MTEKQENIIKAALQLFARDGYRATSTMKIAKLAGVSEGLIFRHFENKEGLLASILQEGAERLRKYFADIVLDTNPASVIKKAMELPFTIGEEEYEFWRLQYKLKWEVMHADESKMEPLKMALTNAFKKLNYPQPELESEFIVLMIDAVASAILRGSMENGKEMLALLKSKYQL
jgi:AcrR family transcriptional regulator